MDLDMLLDAISDVLEGDNPEEVGVLVGTLYDQGVKKYRPLIANFPRVLQKVATDTRPLIKGVLATALQFRTDEEIQALISENTKQRATKRKERLDQFMEAGFTREEGMALLLQDIANNTARAQQLSSASRSAQSRSSGQNG